LIRGRRARTIWRGSRSERRANGDRRERVQLAHEGLATCICPADVLTLPGQMWGCGGVSDGFRRTRRAALFDVREGGE